MVTPRYFPLMGGVETHVYEVSRRLVALGHQVTVITTDPTGELPAADSVDGVRIRRVRAWPSGQDWYVAPQIARAISHGSFDVVHCQGYHTAVAPLAMLSAVRCGIPFVLTFHSGGHSSLLRRAARPWQRTLLRPLLARAAKLIGVSRFEAAFFQEELRLPEDLFTVIPNGGHLPAVPEDIEDRDGGSLIVSIGRLERYKGHHRVIAALPSVLRRKPDTRLRVLGGGPYETELRRLALRLGVADRVEIGPIPATDRSGMARALMQATLVVLLSEYEAHPIAVMEAIALGRPVLVTHTSGLGELADRGLVRGIPLTSTDQEVADAVLQELASPLVPGPIALPTWDECAGQLAAVYSAAVRGRSLTA